MNRLRDGAGDDPVSKRGVELLRSQPGTSHRSEVKGRVWTSLQAARSFGFPERRTPMVRMFAVAITIICMAGTAGAVIARWSARHDQPSTGPAAAAAPAAKPKRGAVRAPRTVAALPPEVEEAPVAAPIEARPSPPAGISRRSAPPPVTAPKALPTTSASVVRERTEVLDAMVALRRDHDPVRAGQLLGRYLAAHPNGALREEALVLAIEAAADGGDTARARDLARTYRAAYPRGRFQQFAADHAGSSGQ